MKFFFTTAAACSLFIATGITAKDPQTINNNNIHIYTSATQASSSTNMLSAVQQMPISSAILEKLTKGGSILDKNRLLLATIASAYIYGRTFVAVVRANHALAESASWASWKPELSLDGLKTLDQAELTKELLHEIQKRHMSVEKPADALLPFITFLGTIDDEITHINTYRSIHFWIETCHATWMFPINAQRFASATTRLERLWFLKNLFLSWAADYKLSSFIKSPTSLSARLYAYLTEKLGGLWPETEIIATDNQTTYLASGQQRARRHTLLAGLIKAACFVPIVATIGHLLPTECNPHTNNNTISVTL